MSSRFVVIGLAATEVGWFARVSTWAATAALPIDFLKCLTPEEARARMSGARHAVLLVDGGTAAADRDLLAHASDAGLAAIVVRDPFVARPWERLGATRVLEPDFGPDELLHALAQHSRPINAGDPHVEAGSDEVHRGHLISVTGHPGAGASVVAMGLAQAIAARPTDHLLAPVLLADFARHADLAMLHGTGSDAVALADLVESHRAAVNQDHEEHTYGIPLPERGYDLLPGLRRHRDWTAIRRRALEVTLDTLVRRYGTTVVEVDADVEGERQTGSVDVEDRNRLSRTALSAADATVVVGRPDLAGIHCLVRVVVDLLEFGVDAERLTVVLTDAPRATSARAEITKTISLLLLEVDEADRLASPVFVAPVAIESSLRAGRPLPATLGVPVAAAVDGAMRRGRDARPASPVPEPVRVRRNSVGHFRDGDIPAPSSGRMGTSSV